MGLPKGADWKQGWHVTRFHRPTAQEFESLHYFSSSKLQRTRKDCHNSVRAAKVAVERGGGSGCTTYQHSMQIGA